MNKHLVNSEEEYVALFNDFELNDAEDFLGVEFAFEDGIYQSDIWKDDSIDEDQEVSRTVYRKTADANFPKKYPCLVLLANEDDFDRTGPTSFKMLEFVYLKDFG